MNELIQRIFADLTVNGKAVPVKYLYYQGHGEPYVVWMQMDKDASVSGDDDLIGYVDYYDFDVYSKGNFLEIVERVKNILKTNGFTWQPSRDSGDMFETETGYYHKTLCFAILHEEVEQWQR